MFKHEILVLPIVNLIVTSKSPDGKYVKKTNQGFEKLDNAGIWKFSLMFNSLIGKLNGHVHGIPLSIKFCGQLVSLRSKTLLIKPHKSSYTQETKIIPSNK